MWDYPFVPVEWDSRLRDLISLPGAAEVLGASLCAQARAHGAIWADVASDGLAVATRLARRYQNWTGVSAALAVLRDGSWESYQDAVRACSEVASHPARRLVNSPAGLVAVSSWPRTDENESRGPAPRHALLALRPPDRAVLADPAAWAVVGAAQIPALLDLDGLAWTANGQARWAADVIAATHPAMAVVARATVLLLERGRP